MDALVVELEKVPAGDFDRCTACRAPLRLTISPAVPMTRKNNPENTVGCRCCGHLMILEGNKLRDLTKDEASRVDMEWRNAAVEEVVGHLRG